jgi:hypothetical protein
MLRKLIILFLLLIATGNVCFGVPASKDPLSEEIARWKLFLKNNTATDEDWTYIRNLADPILSKADQSLRDEHPLYALHLLAAVRYMLAGQMFVKQYPSEMRQQLDALEKEWKKSGVTLQPVLSGKDRPSFEGMSAAVRAVAEASYSEIRPYYESSLEYGRNTVADAGLFYLGAAHAQFDFVHFLGDLGATSAGGSLKIRNLPYEMESFENKLLSVYKPPASVDSHPIFIRTSTTLKQAREMHDAGLEYGALYRYLSARLRLTKITSPDWTINPEEAKRLTDEIRTRLDRDKRTDHSIARLFLEMAEEEANDPTPGADGGKQTARAVFEEVLPHYFAALENPRPQPPRPVPAVTVTLVRWPYT